MKKELESMRPIKEEWAVVKKTVQDTNARVRKVEMELKITSNKIDTLDKQVSHVLPEHEKRITRLEAKPA